MLFNVLNPPSNGLLYNMIKYFYNRYIYIYINPLVIKDGKMENSKSIDDVSIKTLNVGSPS